MINTVAIFAFAIFTATADDARVYTLAFVTSIVIGGEDWRGEKRGEADKHEKTSEKFLHNSIITRNVRLNGDILLTFSYPYFCAFY